MTSESNWPKVRGSSSSQQIIYIWALFSYGGHFVYQSETVLAIFVKGYLSNYPMKFE